MLSVTMRKIVLLTTLFLLVAGLCSTALAAETRYTKVNIHGQTKDGRNLKASYANFTNPGAGHVIIPVGTKIQVTRKSRKAITFTYDNGAKKVVYEFHQPRMGMTVEAYLDKISSANPVKLDGLSALDRKGVEEGKASVGMSRAGVMAALGYPAAHRTPSPDAKDWVYWTNRFGTIVISFGDDGKVAGIRD